MNTIELQTPIDQAETETIERPYPIVKWLEAFVESQKDKRLGWFMVSLLALGVLILPVPAVLIYYYNAPVMILAITLILFFANIIAGMGGSKVSVLMFLVTLNVIVHAIMIGIFVL